MDFWRAVAVLSRRKWLILLSVAATIVLTFGATRFLSSKWVAKVRLSAAPSSPLTAAQGTAAQSSSEAVESYKAQAAIYATIVHSKDVVEAAMKKAGLREVPPKLL